MAILIITENTQFVHRISLGKQTNSGLFSGRFPSKCGKRFRFLKADPPHIHYLWGGTDEQHGKKSSVSAVGLFCGAADRGGAAAGAGGEPDGLQAGAGDDYRAASPSGGGGAVKVRIKPILSFAGFQFSGTGARFFYSVFARAETPVFKRRHADIFAEDSSEVIAADEARARGDFRNGERCAGEQGERMVEAHFS